MRKSKRLTFLLHIIISIFSAKCLQGPETVGLADGKHIPFKERLDNNHYPQTMLRHPRLCSQAIRHE